MQAMSEAGGSAKGAEWGDLSRPRYDLSTFAGRLRHFVSVTSPLTLLASPADLERAKNVVRERNELLKRDPGSSRKVAKEEAARYWKAQQLVQSSVHPDTGETIALPFRMSAFVPTNLIIVSGMMMPTQSLSRVIFWQWANQSLNVAVNYSNANKAGPAMAMSEVGTAYVAATSAAVGISIGLTQLIPRLKGVAPGTRAILTRLVPFAAVGSASVVNVAAMRWRELVDGINVYRPATSEREPEAVGQSAVAGRRAVATTALSRVLTNFPTLVLPPLLLSLAQRAKLVSSVGLAPRLLETAFIGVSLLAFLPPAIAVFPQRACIPASQLEPRFRNMTDEDGKPISSLEYNKGL